MLQIRSSGTSSGRRAIGAGMVVPVEVFALSLQVFPLSSSFICLIAFRHIIVIFLFAILPDLVETGTSGWNSIQNVRLKTFGLKFDEDERERFCDDDHQSLRRRSRYVP